MVPRSDERGSLSDLRSIAVSRYVHVSMRELTVEELVRALDALGLPYECACHNERLELAGSLECAGDLVDVRLAVDTLGSAFSFGFAADEGRFLRLVCSDVDRAFLERALVQPIWAAVAHERVRIAAKTAELDITTSVDGDGRTRLLLKPRSP